MSFEKRKEAAMQELKESGIRKSNGIPPALLIFWKLGIRVRPPHYNSFLKNALSAGFWFAVLFGVLMWFLQWRSMGFGVSGAVATASVAGIFFGVIMAAHYKSSARRHRLSNWADLPSGERNA